jgi:putative ABC transport system substrate-binding protein
MKRRDFITILGGAAAWPLVARAQQIKRVWRIGVLMGWSETDPEYRPRITAFAQALMQAGCVDGQNVRIDVLEIT